MEIALLVFIAVTVPTATLLSFLCLESYHWIMIRQRVEFPIQKGVIAGLLTGLILVIPWLADPGSAEAGMVIVFLSPFVLAGCVLIGSLVGLLYSRRGRPFIVRSEGGITAAIQNRIVRAVKAIQNRIVRAAKLDPQLYEEVEADRAATGQAMAVVVMSAAAVGIGVSGSSDLLGIVGGTILALVGWLIWAFLTYVIGTRLLPEPQTKADCGELLRTIGFASAPGLIRVLGVIPSLGVLVFLVAGVWMLIAMVMAVRQALDYRSTPRAVGVCLIGWLVQAVILFVAAEPLGLGKMEAV